MSDMKHGSRPCAVAFAVALALGLSGCGGGGGGGANVRPSPTPSGDGGFTGGNVDVDAGDTLVWTDDIDGSIDLVKGGAGTLVLAGTNSYTGGTTISTGTLVASSSSLPGAITDNAALVFDQASDGTFTGAITGSGTFAKTGSGTLILDGVSSAFTGTTTVQAGTLEVGDAATPSAALGGDVTVDAGGTLRGHGTVLGNVTNDGIMWPGGSVGTLTIDGDYTQHADGSLQIDVTPTAASALQVSGNASLAGTLNLIYAPGTYTDKTYTLVQAKALSGTFGTMNASGAVPTTLDPSLAYTSTQANLVLASPTPLGRVAPYDGALYANLVHAANQVGQQDLATVLDTSLISGSACSNVTTPHPNPSTCHSGAWVQATGDSLQLDGTPGLHSTAFGLLGGVEGAVTDAFRLGVEAGVGRLNGNDAAGGNGSIDTAHAGLYAWGDAGPLVLSATLDAGESHYRVQRNTGLGHSTARPHGTSYAGGLQAAWPMRAAAWTITPKLGVLYQHQQLDGFSEVLSSSNPLASAYVITGASSRFTTVQPYAGVDFARSFRAGGVDYVPQFTLGYRYDTRNDVPGVNAFAQDGTGFALPGNAAGRGMATVGARISARAGADWTVSLDYSGVFASQLHDNALTLGITKHF